jgi:hypothetical protein
MTFAGCCGLSVARCQVSGIRCRVSDDCIAIYRGDLTYCGRGH